MRATALQLGARQSAIRLKRMAVVRLLLALLITWLILADCLLARTATLTGWVDSAATRSSLQLVQGNAKLSIATEGAGVPYCGVMIDRAGARQGAKHGLLTRGARPALALGPSLGAPDRYADALGDWQSVTWLVPGEARRWTIAMRAGA